MQTETPTNGVSGSRLRSYLQLIRAPNVFTAIADVTMGVVFVRHQLEPLGAWLSLAAASTALYAAGMALNDVYDIEVDARERPARPLPSGRIPLRHARRLGYGALLVGVVLAVLGGFLAGPPFGFAVRSGLTGCGLALCIWLYDAWLKRTPIGPFCMGACRFLNVMMGMSLAAASRPPAFLCAFSVEQVAVAVGIGCYVSGVTWYARGEATRSRRGLLALGLLCMVGGLCLLAFFPRLAAPDARYHIEPRFVWPFAVFVLMVPTLRRCAMGILNPRPRNVQAAVRQCLFSLIVLDASVCLLAAPWPFAVGVLALLAPAILLGRWIYST